jgi:hypothetical protein
MLRIHTLNTTEFLLFVSKQNAMIVFADRLFKSVATVKMDNGKKTWKILVM